ncbi:MAG: sigma-70 family RNA polymerase sigma factor [Deltaproteobacteria bacterium]|nr:sigma-70 family RNA polymerase sigma factor [Deltaproteobacteria bacterium]
MFGRFANHRKETQEFEALTLGLLDTLYAGALRFTRNERDAEDLVQDTYMRAYRLFKSFERGTNIRAWMFKVMTNIFINDYNRSKRDARFTDGAERGVLHERALATPGEDVDAYLRSNWLHHLLSDDVKNALDSLPIEFRTVVILADLHDFSYKEVSEILDCPIGTVMSRLFRGRKILQAALKEYVKRQGVFRNSDAAAKRASDVVDLDDFRKAGKAG